MAEITSSSEKLSNARAESMRGARTLEQVRTCWRDLEAELELTATETDTIRQALAHIARLVARPNCACDSFVKALFPGERQALERLGIPLVFVLHTVRLTAVADHFHDVETQTPDKPMVVFTDNGFGWANEALRVLQEQQREAKEAEVTIARKQEEIRINTMVSMIAENMKTEGFLLDEEKKTTLQPRWETMLRHWKAFADTFLSNQQVRTFLAEHGDKPITKEVYENFVTVCGQVPKIQREFIDAPNIQGKFLDLINPESGWHWVLIKNDKTTMKKFLSAAVGNMNQWFLL